MNGQSSFLLSKPREIPEKQTFAQTFSLSKIATAKAIPNQETAC